MIWLLYDYDSGSCIEEDFFLFCDTKKEQLTYYDSYQQGLVKKNYPLIDNVDNWKRDKFSSEAILIETTLEKFPKTIEEFYKTCKELLPEVFL